MNGTIASHRTDAVGRCCVCYPHITCSARLLFYVIFNLIFEGRMLLQDLINIEKRIRELFTELPWYYHCRTLSLILKQANILSYPPYLTLSSLLYTFRRQRPWVTRDEMTHYIEMRIDTSQAGHSVVSFSQQDCMVYCTMRPANNYHNVDSRVKQNSFNFFQRRIFLLLSQYPAVTFFLPQNPSVFVAIFGF